MKKKGIALIATFAMSVAAFAAGCGGDPNGPDHPDGPTGPKEDVYQDYNPNKQPGGGSFDYEGNYSAPELTIDGKGDDAQWQAITQPLLTYGKKVSDGKGGMVDAVTVKAYRGEKALFFLFDVKDTTLLTYGVTNDDAVTRGDSIEFYIDTKADGGRNPQSDDFQINLGIHGKTRIMQGSGSNWGSWNGLIDYEVGLNGTLNEGATGTDTGYTVEVMIQYKDIMIDKDDTIGLAFGQVDKVRAEDAPSGSESGPWNWYGWTVNGTLVDPQKPNMYILYDKEGKLVSRDDIAMPPVDMAGAVKDKDGNPVAGATATATIGGEEKTATTDETGYFVFEDVDPENDYTVTISKEGYITLTETYTRAELRAANGSIVLKDFIFVSTANLTYTTLTGKVKNIVNGTIGGATVALKGTTVKTTAAADGSFSLANVPANNGAITFVVSKQGYADSETTVAESALVENGTTALGDVNLSLPAGESGAFGMKSGLFANNNAYFSRTLTGVEIFFEGTNNFNGWIELFIDTKESTASRNATNAQYRLHANGTVEVLNHGGNFKTDGIVWNVYPVDGAGYTAKAFIPYDTLNITPLEAFGISLGQNNGQNDWDGWNRSDMPGVNGEAFVKPEMPTDYVRLGATNALYEANHNNAVIIFTGNAKQGGVTVTVGSNTTKTDARGNWKLIIPATNEALNVVYSKIGYVTQTTAIGAGALSGTYTWNETIELAEQKVTVSGVVTDQDGNRIEGVTVTLIIGSDRKTTTTGSDGTYSFEGVTTYEGISIAFEKEDYAVVAPTSITQEALASAKDNVYTANKQLTSVASVRKIALTGKVIGISGNLEGVTVSVEGKPVTVKTRADGTFTLTDFECVDSEIVFTLNGYIVRSVVFEASDVDQDVTEFALDGDVFLAREYEQLGSAFATKSNAFASFTPYVTRVEKGFEFKFVGAKAFANGHIEVFVDTKHGNGDNARNNTDYRFNLKTDGTVTIENFGGSNTVRPAGMLLEIKGTTTAPEVYFTLPYEFLGVTSTEVIGVSFGQWSDAVNDWDGWTLSEEFSDMKGIDGSMFVKPEMTWDYIRIGADNKPFWAIDNDASLLEGYTVHFGQKLDSIHAKVSRDETGITFDFITFGDFGRRGSDLEAVLLYIDTGAPAGGWGNDYQYKIVSDGRVASKNGPWWNINNGTSRGNITISRENGVTRFSYKVLFTDIGLAEGTKEAVGFALVEGWLTNDDNATDPNYGGMIYLDGEIRHEMGDAADTATYLRVDQNGNLVVANSNLDVATVKE